LVVALNERDSDEVKACVHERAEFRSVLGGVEGEVYFGHQGIDRYFDDLLDSFERVVWCLIDVEEGTEDRYIVSLSVAARGRTSGVEVTFVTPNVWTMRDGLITRNDVFREREDALRAAGIEA
jgi:ketosteroid isomerase-like protein